MRFKRLRRHSKEPTEREAIRNRIEKKAEIIRISFERCEQLWVLQKPDEIVACDISTYRSMGAWDRDSLAPPDV